jgi:hypothetical protein
MILQNVCAKLVKFAQDDQKMLKRPQRATEGITFRGPNSLFRGLWLWLHNLRYLHFE